MNKPEDNNKTLEDMLTEDKPATKEEIETGTKKLKSLPHIQFITLEEFLAYRGPLSGQEIDGANKQIFNASNQVISISNKGNLEQD